MNFHVSIVNRAMDGVGWRSSYDDDDKLEQQRIECVCVNEYTGR